GLAGLEGLQDWVAGLPEVRRRVRLRRGVAAAHVTARGAAAKVHPPAVGRQTLLAAGPAGRDGWVDAHLGHDDQPSRVAPALGRVRPIALFTPCPNPSPPCAASTSS